MFAYPKESYLEAQKGEGQRPQSLQGQKEKGLSARDGVLVQLHSRKSDHYGMLAAWTFL